MSAPNRKTRRALAAGADLAAPPPHAISEDTELVIRIPAGKINYVLMGLGKLPLGDIVDLWASIKQQGEKQIADLQKGPPKE